MTDSNTLAQKGAGVKPVKFSNPFSSWQEFLTLVGMPVTAAWNGLLKVGTWIDNSKFGKWANESTPKPALKSVHNTGARPLTNEDIKRMIAESRLGVKNLPAPESKAEPVQLAPAAQATPAQAPTSQSKGYFADNGFANMQSFAARKNWLLDPKNADYVRVLGFNASNYYGSPQLNRGLLTMLEAQKVNLTAEQEANDDILQTKQEPVFANKISVAPAVAKVQTRRPYTDELLHQQAEGPEYIKHVFDYSPDEFNRLMSIKTEASSPYSLKFSRLDPALDAYGSYRKYLNSHKIGGKVNYQKIFK